MRYLKITLSGTALFLVYLWVSVLLNSCNNNKSAATDQSDNIELLADEIDYTEDEFEGEGNVRNFDVNDSEMNTEYNDGGEEESDNSYDESDDYISGDYTSSEPEKTRLEPKKKKSTPAKTNNTSNSYSNDQGNSYGEYMVIAGSYLLEDNAQKMIRKLKGMGYSNAEVVYFDQSQYHSICAGRYDSKSTAKSTSSSLKNQGIDTYVHRKQQ